MIFARTRVLAVAMTSAVLAVGGAAVVTDERDEAGRGDADAITWTLNIDADEFVSTLLSRPMIGNSPCASCGW